MSWQSEFTSLTISENDSLPNLMITHLTSLGAITVAGDDKKSYLQGQLTCDVASLPEEQSCFGAHCDAKGKVWSIFRIFSYQDGYAMVQPLSTIEKELTEIKKYAVFSKVDIEKSDCILLGIMGQEAENYIDSISSSRNDVRRIENGTAVKIDDQRWLLLVDEDAAKNIVTTSNAHKVNDELWKMFDIQQGLPLVTPDVQNEYIPQAFNLQALDGISFSKGCYTGQEMVARAKYRGINKRAMFIVKGKTSEAHNKNCHIELERSVGENWRAAGALLSHYQYADNTVIGLIILPNNLDSDTKLRAVSESEFTWTIQQLPYSVSDE